MGCCQSGSKEGGYLQRSKTLTDLAHDLLPSLNDESRVCTIKLIRLSDIPVANSFQGCSDPFVSFTVVPGDNAAGPQKQQSSVKPSTRNPKWEPPERFQFILSKPLESKIVISVYHYLPGNPKNSLPLGDGTLRMRDVGSGGEKVVKLKQPSDGRSAGEAYLLVTLQSVEEAASVQEHIVYEFQRWRPLGQWGTQDDPAKQLLPSDPGRWCRRDGTHFGKTLEVVAPEVPTGWIVSSGWHTVTTDGDHEGWQYATDFSSAYWHPSQATSLLVRRRSWHREIRKSDELRAAEEEERKPTNPSGKGRRQRLLGSSRRN
eukprot:gene8065-8895_t